MSLSELSSVDRNWNPYHHIDPGFINYRKCFSTFGRSLLECFEQERASHDDPMASVHNNHVIVDLVLAACRHTSVQSLGQVLRNPTAGTPFCSTQELAGTREVYTRKRVRNRVLLPYQRIPKVFLEFSTEHIQNDTGRCEQSSKNIVAIIGVVRRVTPIEVTLAPLIMGAPSLMHLRNQRERIPMDELAFYGFDWYETLPEDIDEFARMKEITVQSADDWVVSLCRLKEQAVKEAIAGLLGDIPYKDWSGEQSDHFTASVHVNGKRVTAAFAFKGSAGGRAFKPMTPRMLGKQGDQIYRLAQTPARLLIIQHCHDVLPSVRATLRAFAVLPHDPRRYCVIDGKDTYRILKAYGGL